MRYWIGVASKSMSAVALLAGSVSFATARLSLSNVCPWVTGSFITFAQGAVRGSNPLPKFTAIGEVVGSEVYLFEMFPGFILTDEIFHFKASDAPIRPCLSNFPSLRTKGATLFGSGILEIPKSRF